MTDIVERLKRAWYLLETGQYDIINTLLVKEAAAEIERLRAAVEIGMSACEVLAGWCDDGGKKPILLAPYSPPLPHRRAGNE